MYAPLAVYMTKLVAAGIIASFALVRDSVEGSLAAMLVSPIGLPIAAIVPAVLQGNVFALAATVSSLVASAAALAAVGYTVRTLESVGRRNNRVARDQFDDLDSRSMELRKRTSTFDARTTVAYACLIGALGAINESPVPGPISFTASKLTLESVGMALAISITVPLVAAGVSFADSVNSRDERRATDAFTGALTSTGLSACNAFGLVIGTLGIACVLGRR